MTRFNRNAQAFVGIIIDASLCKILKVEFGTNCEIINLPKPVIDF